MNSIRISGKPVAKIKATAKFDAKSTSKKLAYPYMLSVNMQDDIRDTVRLLAKRKGLKSLPINGAVSLYIEVCTDKSIPLTGVLKNIQDALNGVAYSDDRHVSSLLIRKSPKISKHDTIRLNLIVTRPIENISDTIDKYNNYVAISAEIETVLENSYLPYVLVEEGRLQQYHYQSSLAVIQKCLKEKYDGGVISNPLGLSVVMQSDSIDGDIDNLAFSYVDNLEGLVFDSLEQVHSLYIRRNISKQDDPYVEIAWHNSSYI